MQGMTAVIGRYEVYGPLGASFLSNLLATFGDKGQLVVVMLASQYDPKRVFLGATAAFGLWSALEVALGAWITRVLPGDVMTILTGSLFVLFGLWTLAEVLRRLPDRQRVGPDAGESRTDGAGSNPLGSRVLPARLGAYGPVVTSFLFILVAEFGDKTQLLTINLAATFPESPVAVFVGVMAALALRTGVDAAIGGQVRRYLPSRLIQLAAAVVFIAFGLAVFGVISSTALLGVVAVSLLSAVAGGVWLATRADDRPGPGDGCD
jgi:putative Ca2+/H+ antiporter (TMEM165/GDT1 family)